MASLASPSRLPPASLAGPSDRTSGVRRHFRALARRPSWSERFGSPESLRESSRRNKDGSKVTYLQLAHNEHHPVTASPVAKVIHNFGRADKVDKEALARLASSISRVLDPIGAAPPLTSSDVEIVDSRRLGGAFVLDQRSEEHTS